MAALQAEARCTVLELGPLEPDQTHALVCQRLGVDALPAAVAELIDGRAAGQPFFATELAYSLRDAGVIEVVDGHCHVAEGVDLATLSLPTTVQGVVTGRIDQLAPRAQLALKVASVIGTAFNEPLLREVHPVPQDTLHLRDQLETLTRVDLALEAPLPDDGYLFKHVITREVAYELMLFAQRRQLHRSIAEHYERAYSDDRPELLAPLAHHWRHAGVVDKAVAYLEKSAVRTFSLGLGRAAVAQGLDAARLLGVTLPTVPEAILPLLGVELGRIQALLAGREVEALLGLEPLRDDDNTAAVIALLMRIMPFAHQSQQSELFALMALRCMSLTVERGHSPFAPVVYAMYSIVYRAMSGDSATAHRFARLALDLDERHGGALHGSVSFIHTWFNQHWLHPVRHGIHPSLHAAERALAAGDVLYGCFNLSAHVVYLAVSGQPLERVINVASAHYRRNAGRVRNAAFHCVHELQVAKALAGRTLHRSSLSDTEFDEERDVASICATDHYNQIGYYHVSRLRLHYLYREYAMALENADKALACLPAFAGQVGESELIFFHALALLGRAGELPAAERARCVEAVMPMIERLRGWSELCGDNFRHKLELVQAEQCRVRGQLQAADALYRAAAASAAMAGYVQHEALAQEMRAAALYEAGGDGWPQACAAAREAYLRWGAQAKVDDLDARFAMRAAA